MSFNCLSIILQTAYNTAMNRLLLGCLIILLFLTYQVIFINKFFHGVFIGDSNLTFLTKPQAAKLLTAKFNQRSAQTLSFSYQNKIYTIDLATSSATAKIDAALTETFDLGHKGSPLQRLRDQLTILIQKRVITPELSISVDNQIEPIFQATFSPPKDALLTPEGEIETEVVGRELDRQELNLQITGYLFFGQLPTNLPIKDKIPNITTAKANIGKNHLKAIEKDPIKLTFADNIWSIDNKTLLPLLDLENPDQIFDKEKLSDYLKVVSDQVDQPLKEAQFNFNPSTGRVAAFQPAQEGRALDMDKTATLIRLALKDERAKTITLPVEIIAPSIPTDQVNDLGIKELIGQGLSHFAGSIQNRIYNVSLTAGKINGVLIPPGEVFSFNKTVGDISAATGFKQAYVIKEGRTVLDDGGGVCQDSTTLFRAVLNAGLPVVKRTAHAYRVGYYEQGFPPGLDATVFYPTVDFQFKNDTDHHILIQAYTKSLTLYVDLYGTSDNRVATLTKPVVTDPIPAAPELRQDDPSLPKGVVKQVDWAATGAKVSFQRTVKRGGQSLINETWKSNYKPWQAIYLVGTGG